MKSIYFIFIGLFFGTLSCGQQTSQKQQIATDGTTVYYLIRHAEKDRSDPENSNPDLKAEGLKRAQRWATRFEDVDLDMVYTTNYHRTQQTAAPTAESKGISVTMYDPSTLYDEAFQKETKGKKVLIVGHSNTTPQFANAIMGRDHFPSIDDSDNSNLFIISVTEDGQKLPQHEQMD